MTVKVERILTSGGRISEGVSPEPEADIANVRGDVHEIQAAVVRLAEHIDSLEEKLAASSSRPRRRRRRPARARRRAA